MSVIDKIEGHDKSSGPTDTPKKKKHREEVIVIGTLVLVLLTFILVVRRGSGGGSTDSGVTSDSSGFVPSDAGGSAGGGQDLGQLPLMIGDIPGQVAAQTNAQQKQTADLLRRTLQRVRHQQQQLNLLTKRQKQIQKEEKKLLASQHVHPLQHGHPKAPAHKIHVSAHTPAHKQHTKKGDTWHSVAAHPPQHHEKKQTQHFSGAWGGFARVNAP